MPRSPAGFRAPADAHLVRVSALAARDPEALAAAAGAALDAGVPAAELHEALLQSYLFVGYPRAINALGAFARAAAARGVRVPEPDAEPPAIGRWRRRGERLCRTIYGPKFARMMENMRLLHPRLAEWIVWEGYGKVLSRPRLDARRRELCVLGILAVDGALPQLAAHVRGAQNVGAAPAEIAAVHGLVRAWVPRRLRAAVRACFAAAGARGGAAPSHRTG
ncbi:MAG: carboxymuconolactone decarboxylase family protein [Planctomycetes bacterium]|nr:carboxymuconolactone decarboxylase family protein [Planctomycetota bacterium]